jgi:hypothetical protein
MDMLIAVKPCRLAWGTSHVTECIISHDMIFKWIKIKCATDSNRTSNFSGNYGQKPHEMRRVSSEMCALNYSAQNAGKSNIPPFINSPNRKSSGVTLLLFIREVLGSNLGSGTAYPGGCIGGPLGIRKVPTSNLDPETAYPHGWVGSPPGSYFTKFWVQISTRGTAILIFFVVSLRFLRRMLIEYIYFTIRTFPSTCFQIHHSQVAAFQRFIT